ECLAMYDEWGQNIDLLTKHHRLKRSPTPWTDKQRILHAFDNVFKRYQDSIIVVSYRSDGLPTESELSASLQKYKRHVHVKHYGQYKYVLSTNGESKEILMIGT